MIEVGEYIRTKSGLIGKVNKIELKGSGTRFTGEFITDTIIQFDDGKVYERRVKDENIVNHSKDLIDLIEVGDIVNNGYVYEIGNTEDGHKWVHNLNGLLLLENEIKTILTKEQYQANCYTVEREKDERNRISRKKQINW